MLKQLLETAQASAAWPVDRVATQLLKDGTCPLCGQDATNKWHKYWIKSHKKLIGLSISVERGPEWFQVT